MSINNMANQLAFDMSGFQRMQHNARVDPEEGAYGAAQQFEALFVQMMMKSMRDAIPSSGLMNSSTTDTYQQMLDQQWSQVVADKGVGLADVLVEQLQRQGAIKGSTQGDNETQALIAGIPRGTPRVLDDPLQPPGPGGQDSGRFLSELEAIRQGKAAPEVSAEQSVEEPVASTNASMTAPVINPNAPDHVKRFMTTLSEPAQAASRASGVPAELILAQAALETGWGRHEIATHEGRNSHNLFGIKAGSHWQGDTTDIATHEYLNGQRTRMVDTFRVYDSFEHAFTDYANLIGNNPRYAGVVEAPNAEQAARELQRGGYATDPRYADKLVAIMNTMGPLSTGQEFLANAR